MFISDETVSRVREANDIVEVIGEYVPGLKRAGKDYKMVCPFHQEKTPSFLVSPSKGIFHCFGCGIGGDLFKFVMEFEHSSYPEAIQKLAERKGIPIQSSSSSDLHLVSDRKTKIFQILQRATQFYHRALMNSPEGKKGLNYLLKERGLQKSTIEKFQLGWASAKGQSLLKMATRSGYSESELIEAGLVHRSEKGDRTYDWFRNRILFPITNMKGQVVGFGGRILEEETWANGTVPPKYINSVESPVFQKGKNLYGLYQGSKSVRDSDHLLVVEGYLDVIGCHQAGVEFAVAPLGTSLTMDQCQILKRYASQVTLLFDSDKAGDSAAVRGAGQLLELDLLPMIARLPEGVDADDYLKDHSREEFLNILRRSVSYFEFKLGSILSKSGSVPDLVKKVQAVHTLLPEILKVDSEVVRSEIVKLLAHQLKIDQGTILEELKKLGRGKEGSQRKSVSSPRSVRKSMLTSEEEIVCMAVRNPVFRKTVFSFYQENPLLFGDMLQECLQLLQQHSEWTQNDLLNHLGESSSQWLRGSLFQQVESTDPENIFQTLMDRLKLKKNELERKKLEKQIVSALNEGNSFSGDILNRYQTLTHQLKG